jgi:hypothetical protein
MKVEAVTLEGRHAVYFSVIASEWPDVKAGLEQKLTRNREAR